MNNTQIRNVSTWLSTPWLRKLRGLICSVDVHINDNEVETRSGKVCSIVLKRFGIITSIPYENILSVDLKESHRVELIFNEHQYIERKLNIYTDSANSLADLIGEKMELVQ